jgi:hypothetical protein
MKMSKNSLIFIGVLALIVVVGLFTYFGSPKSSQSQPNNIAGSDQDPSPILACYSAGASQPIPNNSVQNVKETSRLFINVPKNLYPQDLQGSWTTVSGNATAGTVGGGYGEAQGATSECWSSQVDFEGTGEIDLRVKSTVADTPDYFVRFIVSQ